MEKKKKIILGIGIGIFLILLGLGTTYAYWVMTHKQTEDNVVSTGCFKIEYAEGNGVTLSNGFPVTDEEGLTYETYTFQISNLCNDSAAYQVNMETMPQGNNIKVLPDKYVKVGVSENEGPSVITKLDKEENPDIEVEPNIGGAVAAYKVLTGKLMRYETKSFEVRIWMSSDTPAVEESMNASYLGKVSVVTSYLEDQFAQSGTLMTVNPVAFWYFKEDITKVVFEPTMNPHETREELIFDVSDTQDESVMSYLVPNDEDPTTYTVYIQSKGGVRANPNSDFLFLGFFNVTEIQGLEYFDTSNATSMWGMFQSCSSLTSLDLSNFDTSKVTNMSFMFLECWNLANLDVSNFDTSNVTDMTEMFNYCYALNNLDVSGFDTSNVASTYLMFGSCNSLTNLDVSNFDTSNVTTMWVMFAGCNSLTNLDVSNFDTSQVINMYGMFSGCSSLTSLDVSSFNTRNVTDMYGMFNQNTQLREIIYSDKFIYANDANIDKMFDDCPANKPTHESWNGKF